MKYLVLLALLCLPVTTGCSLLTQPDLTPIAQSVTLQQSMHLKTLEVMKGWIEGATGITEEQRKAALEAIQKDKEAYLMLSVETLKTLKTMGDLNWKELAKKLAKEGKEVYDTFKEHFGELL